MSLMSNICIFRPNARALLLFGQIFAFCSYAEAQDIIYLSCKWDKEIIKWKEDGKTDVYEHGANSKPEIIAIDFPKATCYGVPCRISETTLSFTMPNKDPDYEMYFEIDRLSGKGVTRNKGGTMKVTIFQTCRPASKQF